MRVEVKSYRDDWQIIKDNALFTIHKENGKYPSTDWKREMLVAEHSPIRSGRLIINCYDVPSFVINHIVRHFVGFTPFVSTLRSDRYESEEVPNRNTLNNLRFDGNFQSFINISRKRNCFDASKETREFWELVLEEVKKYEPELYWVCVPECIHCAGCKEKYPCNEHHFTEFLRYVGKDNLTKLFDVHKRYDYYQDFRRTLK